VADALGVPVTELPLDPDRLWRLIHPPREAAP
jgi:CO/xanthine dehydrogenase Mo-binding subunit